MNRIVKQPEERYREIVDTAKRLFEQHGYENTTMRHIMDELNIAKGTIYHYFTSKEDLLEAVVTSTVDEFIAAMKAVLHETEGDGLTKLRALTKASSIEETNAPLLEYLHIPANIGMHTRQLAELVNKLAPLYAQAIEQGVTEGIFQTDHPLESAEFILAGMQFITDMGVYPWKPQALSRRAAALPALAEAQLKAPKGSFDFLVE